jgi:hypothetical protein
MHNRSQLSMHSPAPLSTTVFARKKDDHRLNSQLPVATPMLAHPVRRDVESFTISDA